LCGVACEVISPSVPATRALHCAASLCVRRLDIVIPNSSVVTPGRGPETSNEIGPSPAYTCLFVMLVSSLRERGAGGICNVRLVCP
jgi:hypothetical protein